MANEKILNTRVQLKYDTLANWNASTFIPKKGEMCIATVDTAQKDAKGNIVTVPTLLIKVGSGSAPFAALPFVSAPAADVYDWAKQSEAEFVSNFLKLEGMQAVLDGVFATDKELASAIKEVKDLIAGLDERLVAAEEKIVEIDERVATLEANPYDDAEVRALIAKNASDLAAHKENVATIHNMQAQTDAALLTKIQTNRDNIAAEVAARQALGETLEAADEALGQQIATVASDLTAHKNNMAEIHNMQAQTDAALLTKIQKNREDIAANKAAQDTKNTEVDDRLDGIDNTIANHVAEAAQINAAQAEKNAELASGIEKNAADLVAFKNNQATIQNMQAQTDAALLTKIQKNREDIVAEVAAREALAEAVDAADSKLGEDIAALATSLTNYKNEQAQINNMQAQNDAALMDKIRTNRENIAANKAAQDEVNAGVVADIEAVNATIAANKSAQDEVNAAQAETNATLAADIAKNAEDLVAHKNDMATIHDLQGQIDAELSLRIKTNKQNLAAEVERATAAEKANADEIARVNAVLEAALDNDGEGIDSIKELATWVAEHGAEAAALTEALDKETADRKAADEQLSKDIVAAIEASEAADAALSKDIADLATNLSNYKDEQAQIHNMQAQNDAALLVKIQQNRENLANEVAAREALEATALQTVSTGVGLKATKTGTDAKVEIDDSVVFVFDCGSATENID